MQRTGFTLLETMLAVGILTIVMGALMGISLSFANTVEIQEIKSTGNDESRAVLTRLIPELRQASSSSINWGDLPGPTLTYRIPEDIDGNGLAVDGTNSIELSGVITVTRDTDDLNDDGIAGTQLIHIRDNVITVLANNIRETDEGTDDAGIFTMAQDANGNGVQDIGLQFEAWNSGLMFTVQAEDTTRSGHDVPVVLREIVYPRN